MSCPECSGRNKACAACGGSGVIVIERCPYEELDSGTMRAIALARMARRGAWPIEGGTLAQTQWFVDFCQALGADEARAQQCDADDLEE